MAARGERRTTPIKYWNDARQQSVVSVRFKIADTDRMNADVKKVEM